MTLEQALRHIRAVEGCSTENALAQLRADLPLMLKRWGDARDADDYPPSSRGFWDEAYISMERGGVVLAKIGQKLHPALLGTGIHCFTSIAQRPLLVDRQSVMRRWSVQGPEPVRKDSMAGNAGVTAAASVPRENRTRRALVRQILRRLYDANGPIGYSDETVQRAVNVELAERKATPVSPSTMRRARNEEYGW